jgi:hypothetical protein
MGIETGMRIILDGGAKYGKILKYSIFNLCLVDILIKDVDINFL